MTSPWSEEGLHRRRKLRTWFATRRREFSWRRTRDPWAILIAETLLRRTRAAQVEERLPDVLGAYPTPADMARAPLSEIREVLRPFGLQWRADNLAEASQMIVQRLGGRVPTEVSELLSLPGVGPYVAAATAAATSEAEVVLVDTNSVRVACRVDGIALQGDIRRRPEVVSAVDRLLGGPASAKDWWAVLDLGALVCTARHPDCSNCPIQPSCATGRDAQRIAAGSSA